MTVFPFFLLCIKHLAKPVDSDDSFNRIPFFRIRKQRRQENFRFATLYTISLFFKGLRENIIGDKCIGDIFTVIQKGFLILFNLSNYVVSGFSTGPKGFFPTMKGVEREDAAGQTEFLHQPPRRRNFIAFLPDFFMSENDGAITGESAQHLKLINTAHIIETSPEGFAVAMNEVSLHFLSREKPAVLPENSLKFRGGGVRNDIADSCIRRGFFPIRPETLIESFTMSIDKFVNLSIRISIAQQSHD